jgi:hypothetical protein
VGLVQGDHIRIRPGWCLYRPFVRGFHYRDDFAGGRWRESQKKAPFLLTSNAYLALDMPQT